MAYIDKMQALEICENYSQHCFDTNNSQGQQVADDILDEILELPSSFWWRKISIKKPEQNGYYLTYYLTSQNDYEMSKLYYKDGIWLTSYKDAEIVSTVTHWMELPYPPIYF